MEITDNERRFFGELFWDALDATDPEDWADYAEILTMFCHVAPDHILQGRYDDLVKSGVVTEEMQRIGTELAKRANDVEGG